MAGVKFGLWGNVSFNGVHASDARHRHVELTVHEARCRQIDANPLHCLRLGSAEVEKLNVCKNSRLTY